MKNNPKIKEMLESSELSLSIATNKEGKAISEGLYADELKIGDYTFNDVSIGVTSRLKSLKKICRIDWIKVFPKSIYNR
ncbi:MAG: hypothetical protein K2G23_06035 [Muribaculaceae bacterium]|nr:hypothetical protein [Muribaculaceae bacterium]